MTVEIIHGSPGTWDQLLIPTSIVSRVRSSWYSLMMPLRWPTATRPFVWLSDSAVGSSTPSDPESSGRRNSNVESKSLTEFCAVLNATYEPKGSGTSPDMSQRDRRRTGSSRDRADSSRRWPHIYHASPFSVSLQTTKPLSSPLTGTADTGRSTVPICISPMMLPSAAETVWIVWVSENVNTTLPLAFTDRLVGMPLSGINVISASAKDGIRNRPRTWNQM